MFIKTNPRRKKEKGGGNFQDSNSRLLIKTPGGVFGNSREEREQDIRLTRRWHGSPKALLIYRTVLKPNGSMASSCYCRGGASCPLKKRPIRDRLEFPHDLYFTILFFFFFSQNTFYEIWYVYFLTKHLGQPVAAVYGRDSAKWRG